MTDAPNLTPEKRAILKQLEEAEREAEKLSPPSKAFQARAAEGSGTGKFTRDSRNRNGDIGGPGSG